jgi:hypothetical protein
VVVRLCGRRQVDRWIRRNLGVGDHPAQGESRLAPRAPA